MAETTIVRGGRPRCGYHGCCLAPGHPGPHCGHSHHPWDEDEGQGHNPEHGNGHHDHGHACCGHDHGGTHSHAGHAHDHGDCACAHVNPFEDYEAESDPLELWVLLSGFLVLVTGIFIAEDFSPLRRGVFYGVPWLLCGWPVLSLAWKSLLRRDFFNEFTLMGGASLAAAALGELPEALAVMIFYQLGEYFQDRAVGRSRCSIRALLAEKPSVAHVMEREATRDVPPEEIEAGMRVLVRPGEKIPVDGMVLEGTAQVNTAPITGESVPVRASEGTGVYGGTVCLDGSLVVEASGPFADSEIARVMEMVEKAAENKSPVERFISRFAAWYTPLIFAAALLTFLLLPFAAGLSWRASLYRALVILMVSCPCALVISVPLGYFGGIGAASKRGILVKGGSVIDQMSEVSTVAFDKTGTLTEGVFRVTDVRPAPGVSRAEVEEAARTAEALSSHPLARSIREAFGPVSPEGIQMSETAGQGVRAEKSGRVFWAGRASWLEEQNVRGVSPEGTDPAATLVCLAEGTRFLGTVSVSDVVREDSALAVRGLKEHGIRIVMLTGDREDAARSVASSLGVDAYRAALLPEMKVAALGELAESGKAAFVGDGVNDAPLLAGTDVGIAMGALGSDVAIEAADAVVLNDMPSRVTELVDISKRTRSIVLENIIVALGTKFAFLALGFFGVIGLWEAIFADVGVAVLAILNSSRAILARGGRTEEPQPHGSPAQEACA